MRDEEREALEELVDLALRDAAAKAVYTRRDVILAALSSCACGGRKPLAVVEGCELHRFSNSPTMYELEGVFESQEELCEEGITIPVQVLVFALAPEEAKA